MVKAVAFVRVSSTSQDYTRQISDLMPLIKEDGYSDDEIAIIKHKESASKLSVTNRKTIQDLIEIINKNEIQAVYVQEISRLARRSDVLYNVLALLEEKHIALVVQIPSIIRTWKMNGTKWERDAFAHIIIQFLEQAAVNELENKAVRQKSGYEQAIKEGKVVSSKVKFGYTRDRNGYVSPNEEQVKIVNEIFDLYLSDYSVATIWERYKHTGIFGNIVKVKTALNKISRILRDKTYIGKNKYFKYPAIIDEEKFNAAQAKLDCSKLVKTKLMYVYYCQGLLKIAGNHTMTPCVSKAIYLYKDLNTKKEWGINMNVIDSLAFNLACEAKSTMDRTSNKERLENVKRKLEVTLQNIEGIKKDIINNQEETDRISYQFTKGKINTEKYDFEIDRVEGELDHLLKEQEKLNITKTQLEAVLSKADKEQMQGVMEYNNLLSIKDDNIRQSIVRETIKRIVLEPLNKGEYNIRIDYVDESLNEDTYYAYRQKGPVIRLYCCYGNAVEDWTGTWEKRIYRLKDRRDNANKA